MLLFDGANCCFLLCIFFWNPKHCKTKTLQSSAASDMAVNLSDQSWAILCSGSFKTHPSEKRYARQFQVGLNMNKHIWSHHLVCCYHQINTKQTFFKTICTVGLNAVNLSTSCLGNRGEWRMILLACFSHGILTLDPLSFGNPSSLSIRNQLPVFASLNHAFKLKWLYISTWNKFGRSRQTS